MKTIRKNRSIKNTVKRRITISSRKLMEKPVLNKNKSDIKHVKNCELKQYEFNLI